MARFCWFLVNSKKLPSYELVVLDNLTARDIITTTGNNVKLVSEKSGLDPWVFGSARIKEELARAEIVEVAETDQWRTDYLRKLLEQRQILQYEGIKEGKERLSDLINSICIN